MPKKTKPITYPIIAPKEVIELINEHLDDLPDPDDMVPGVNRALKKLNKLTGAGDPEEGFAAWVYGFNENGTFWVSADQPHYIKTPGMPRDYFFDPVTREFIHDKWKK